MKKFEVVKVFCNSCKGERNHDVVGSHTISIPIEYQGQDTGEKYFKIMELVQCKGCDEYAMRYAEYAPMDLDHDSVIDYKIIPPRKMTGKTTKSYPELDPSTRSVYRQTIDAFNLGMNHLCAAGLRTLVEAICSRHNILDGLVKNESGEDHRRHSLEGKINGLHEKGILTKASAEMLHAHRFFGNEALHELSAPHKKDLEKCIEIIEHVLDGLFVMPGKYKKIQNKFKKSKEVKITINKLKTKSVKLKGSKDKSVN